jgi:hypothetical protein
MTTTTMSVYQLRVAIANHMKNGGEDTDRLRPMSTGNLIVFRDDKVIGELPIAQQVNIKDPAGLITKVRYTESDSRTWVYGVVNGRECFIISYPTDYDYNFDDFLGKTITEVFTAHHKCEQLLADAQDVCVEYGRIERVTISMVGTGEGLHGTVTGAMEHGDELVILEYENVGEYAYSVDHFIGKTKEQAIDMHQRNEELAASLKTRSL